MKLPLTSTLALLPPTVTVWDEMEPDAVGALFGLGFTVTEKVSWSVTLPLLVPATVTVVVPAAIGVIVTVVPDRLTVATPVSAELTV